MLQVSNHLLNRFKINYLRFFSPEFPVIVFNSSNHPHNSVKLVFVNNKGYTVGGTDNTKTEILNFDTTLNDITGEWIDIAVFYPSGQNIYDYAALAIESTVYLFGGRTDGYNIDRVVVFKNNEYNEIGKFQQGRYAHQVIQIGILVYIIGGNCRLKTEIWDLNKNETIEKGDKLNYFVYYPLLYHVHPDQCSSCSKNCNNGDCVMVDGNEHCRCHSGYANLNNNPLEPCQDIDECESGPCGYGSCSNFPGSFNCACPVGFLQGEGSQQCQTCEQEGFEPGNQFEPCQDIDECENFNCGEGICQNNIGSHNCICNEGFVNAWNDQSAICGHLMKIDAKLNSIVQMIKLLDILFNDLTSKDIGHVIMIH